MPEPLPRLTDNQLDKNMTDQTTPPISTHSPIPTDDLTQLAAYTRLGNVAGADFTMRLTLRGTSAAMIEMAQHTQELAPNMLSTPDSGTTSLEIELSTALAVVLTSPEQVTANVESSCGGDCSSCDCAEVCDETAKAEKQSDTSVYDALAVIRDAIKLDSSYAWSWQCNLAMSFVDAGGEHKTANEGAARFMRSLFNVDTTTCKEYVELESRWAEQTAAAGEPTTAPVAARPALCAPMLRLPGSFRNAAKGCSLSAMPLPDLFWETPTFIVDRADCETDETMRQLIPYIVLRNPVDNTFFTYSRGKGGAEARLLGKLSIGLGGHIDGDVPENLDLKEWCTLEAERELKEEAGISTALAINFTVLLCDQTNAVGRVHIGLLAIVNVDPSVIATLEADVIENGTWLTREDLIFESRLENWSVASVPFLPKEAG